MLSLVLLGALFAGPAAWAQGPGSLDAAFDFDGKAYSPRALHAGSVGGVVIQPGGKIVVAGSSWAPNSDQRGFAFVRHDTDGSVDSTFGGDGKVEVPFGDTSGGFLTDVAVQSDGKIVAVGGSGGEGEILRLSADGVVDSGFGTGGKTSLASVEFEAVLVEPDGDIVVAGSYVSTKKDFMIARFTPAGVLDSTFAGDGIAVVPVSAAVDEAFAVGLLSDGSLVAAGNARAADNTDVAVVRVSDAGVPVAAFGGGDGIVTTPIGTDQDRASALAVQPDDRIVVGGRSMGPSDNAFAMARYLADGSLDPSFDTDGMVTADLFGRYEAILEAEVLGDGRILAAGEARDDEEPLRRVALMFSAAGSLDPAFGAGGSAAGPVGSGSAEGLAIDGSGRILVATGVWDRLKGDRWVLSRLVDSASPDTVATLKAVAPKKVALGGRIVVKGKLSSADPSCVAKQEVAVGLPYPEMRRDTKADGSFRFKLSADKFRFRKRMIITVGYEGTDACVPPEDRVLRVRIV